MTFATPLGLWLALVAPALIGLAFFFDGERRRALVGRLGDGTAVRRMMASASPARRRVKAMLFTVAILLLALAAARPQISSERAVRRSGLDVVIALDVSKSMLVRDLPAGTRLDRARGEIRALLRELEDDRVSMVVFAGAAVHFPLSHDHDALEGFADDLGPSDVPGGSDLGEALRVARCVLRPDLDELGCARIGGRGRGGDPLPGDEEADASAARDAAADDDGGRGKAIVIFTDGGDSSGRAAEEVLLARELGIAVFLVGVATREGGPVPEIDEDGRPIGTKRDDRGQPVSSALDEEGLRAIAAVGGDVHRFLPIVPDADPDPHRLLGALGQVTRGTRTHREVGRKADVYPFLVFPAFVLLVIEACIGTRRRVRYPEVEE